MINSNPVLEALHSRRSIRQYSKRPVERDKITAILEAGRMAPSGFNRQPWRFLVLYHDDSKVSKIAKFSKFEKILNNAKFLIFVFLDRRDMYEPLKDYQAAGNCCLSMMLAGHSLNIGMAWLGEIVAHEVSIMPILEIDPQKYELQTVMTGGYPATKGICKRKELNKLLIGEY